MPSGETPKKNPLVTVLSVVASGESSHAFRDGTRALTLRCNEITGDVRYSWATGEVNNDSGDWQILRNGEILWEDDIFFSGVAADRTVYLRMDSGTAKNVSVVEWR